MSSFAYYIISKDIIRKKDWQLLPHFFDLGLHAFHIRSSQSTADIIDLIKTIPSQYYSKIVVHHRPEIVDFFDEKIKLHTRFEDKHLWGIANSCSVHSWEEYELAAPHFPYIFISPVFNSISKKGYFANKTLKEVIEHDTPVIALGGINITTARKVREMGYDGVALLGTIWTSKAPLLTFKKICHATTTDSNNHSRL